MKLNKEVVELPDSNVSSRDEKAEVKTTNSEKNIVNHNNQDEIEASDTNESSNDEQEEPIDSKKRKI